MSMIAITGGAGFVGSHLVKKLTSSGYSPVVLDKVSPNHLQAVSDQDDLPDNPKFLQTDITDSRSIDDSLSFLSRNWSLEGIIHLAAISRVKDGREKPRDCIAVNILGTTNILDYTRKAEQSLWTIIGSTNESGDNIYGISKRASEEITIQYGKDYGVRTLPLRFASVYGQGDNPDKLIPLLIRKALASETITIDNGRKNGDFIHVEDLVSGIHLAAMYLQSGGDYSGPIPICTGVNTDYSNLACMIRSETNSRSQLIIENQGTVSNISLDTSVAKSILGFEANLPLRKGIQRTVRSMRNA